MFVRTGDIVAHVQVDGPPGAPAVLLIHSLGTTLHIWDAQAHMLAGAYRVVRYDLRGHGLTETTAAPYTIPGLAADAFALLDALGITQAHVAGVSIGGLIAQAMAAASPERVASLVLCDTALSVRPVPTWEERVATVRAQGLATIADGVLARWVTQGFQGSPTAAGLRTMLLRTDPEGYCGAGLAIAVDDRTEATARLRMPTLVLMGEHDIATPPAAAEAIRATIPGARLMTIADAAHIPTVEQPAAVNAALHEFFAELHALA
jgi:3-oxoadipate enol-lactonase